MSKTLIIVDFQFDFYNKKGSLYVNDAERAEKKIINLLNSNKDINHVVFTMDWHEYYDESFEINGGKWPIHCVQNTVGAGVSTKLVNACHDNGLNPEFIYKGDCPYTEEYGAFSKLLGYNDTSITLGNKKLDNQISFLNNELIICGLAGDYCVKETIENLLKYEWFDIEVFKDGIASIDNGETLNKLIQENSLNIISL